MNYGKALSLLKDNFRVAREGWLEKGMWLTLIKPDEHGEDSILLGRVDPDIYFGISDNKDITITPCIAICTESCKLQLGWLPTYEDMFAEDWHIVGIQANTSSKKNIMSVFRYYITDLMNGKVVGTNSTEDAESLANCEDYFVVDTQTNEWVTDNGRKSIEEIRPTHG